MARARVVLPAPSSPHSATASPVARPPAMAAPSRAVASRSGRAKALRKVSPDGVISSAFSPPAPRPEGPGSGCGCERCCEMGPGMVTPRPNWRNARKMPGNIVIVGAGQAACQAVQTLRAEGVEAPIVMIGDEAYAPYQRPPLSKAYLLGNFERPRLFLKADSYYPEAGCELIVNTSVTAIHRAERGVELSTGRKLAYDKLLLATGARVRRLGCPGADLSGVHY